MYTPPPPLALFSTVEVLLTGPCEPARDIFHEETAGQARFGSVRRISVVCDRFGVYWTHAGTRAENNFFARKFAGIVLLIVLFLSTPFLEG